VIEYVQLTPGRSCGAWHIRSKEIDAKSWSDKGRSAAFYTILSSRDA
jgi:hypothetical protein